jgi:hypothetical protein
VYSDSTPTAPSSSRGTFPITGDPLGLLSALLIRRMSREGAPLEWHVPGVPADVSCPPLPLFARTPLVGEPLLADLKSSTLYLAPFLAPPYGAGAVLVRDGARRTCRGYGAMLVLGVAQPETGPRTAVDSVGTGLPIVGASFVFVTAVRRLRSTMDRGPSCSAGALR